MTNPTLDTRSHNHCVKGLLRRTVTPSLPTFINTFEAGDVPLTLEGKMHEAQRFIDNQLEELDEI
jgi:hypothetical protein